MQILAANLTRVMEAHPALARAPLVGAGCGRFLGEALAQREGRGFIGFGELVDASDASQELPEWMATCAPSVAVALLSLHGVREPAVAWFHSTAAS
jgi:hypothetical protein